LVLLLLVLLAGLVLLLLLCLLRLQALPVSCGASEQRTTAMSRLLLHCAARLPMDAAAGPIVGSAAAAAAVHGVCDSLSLTTHPLETVDTGHHCWQQRFPEIVGRSHQRRYWFCSVLEAVLWCLLQAAPACPALPAAAEQGAVCCWQRARQLVLLLDG